jgi:hypothetical protein
MPIHSDNNAFTWSDPLGLECQFRFLFWQIRTGWRYQNRGRLFGGFWYEKRLCDAYLRVWRAEELIRVTNAEHPPTVNDPLIVWKGLKQYRGRIDAQMKDPMVAHGSASRLSRPDLWCWEIIIHLLGLALAGCFASPDNGA